MSVGIIASAAYINPEMAVEFGRLPPAFLPAGNARLFVRQVELLRRFVDRVVLTLPENFRIAPRDGRLLDSLAVKIVRIADGLNLAESIMLALIQSVEGEEPVVLLHGDTLFVGLESFPCDALSVHAEDHPYPWAVLQNAAPVFVAPVAEGACAEQPIISGLFSFSRGVDFLRGLARTRDLLSALNDYAAFVPSFRAVENCGLWLDLGHLNTYYESRRTLTTERAFNSISISRGVVRKTSDQREKMEAEAAWFEELPVQLKPYVPTYLGRLEASKRGAGYSLSYEYLCPLNDLFVFGALPAAIWRRILASCNEVLQRFRLAKPDGVRDAWFTHLYNGKAVARFESFAQSAGIDSPLDRQRRTAAFTSRHHRTDGRNHRTAAAGRFRNSARRFLPEQYPVRFPSWRREAGRSARLHRTGQAGTVRRHPLRCGKAAPFARRWLRYDRGRLL